jgi:redox-sensitive bicupin YhaK (pirin superfamily)
MIKLRKSNERGFFNHGWLQTHHSFSFANYYDPQFMGWGNLRVINEDWIAPGMGFGTHGHRDMEIVTYVLEGELAHKDSMGNVESIPPGDVQRMSAGTGVQHSEFNHAPGEKTHLLQIWIEPNKKGVTPGYEQKAFPREEKLGKLRLVASPTAENGSVLIHADAKMYVGLFDEQHTTSLEIDPARKAYVHLVRGEAQINGQALQAGDALMLEGEKLVDLQRAKNAEVLVFDLAA